MNGPRPRLFAVPPTCISSFVDPAHRYDVHWVTFQFCFRWSSSWPPPPPPIVSLKLAVLFYYVYWRLHKLFPVQIIIIDGEKKSTSPAKCVFAIISDLVAGLPSPFDVIKCTEYNIFNVLAIYDHRSIQNNRHYGLACETLQFRAIELFWHTHTHTSISSTVLLGAHWTDSLFFFSFY